VGYALAMPPKQRVRQPQAQPASGKRCSALTTSGQPCRRAVVPGLTVCKSHGGGTAASVRVSKRAQVTAQAATLWGINTDTGSISVEEELTKLARNKLTDVLALRLKISEDSVSRHIGTLTETHTMTEYDIIGTVQSKQGTQETRVKRAGTSVWVQELHKAEQELVQIFRLLQEVTGGSEETDVRRIRLQTARETARLLKAFPGLGVDEVAAEVSKRAS
jgi:hypothetical protein